MKKIIVSFITAGLLGWQVPSQSQEQYANVRMDFDLDSEFQSSTTYLDPPIHENIRRTISLEYSALKGLPLRPAIDGNFKEPDLRPQAKNSFVQAINQYHSVHAVKSINRSIPDALKYKGSSLPNWIKPSTITGHSENRMRLPEVFGIKLNF